MSDSICVYVHAIFYAFVCLSLLKCVRKYDDSDNTLSIRVYPAGRESDVAGCIS